MPLSPVTESTLQASVLGAISNVLAQALTAYNNKVWSLLLGLGEQ